MNEDRAFRRVSMVLLVLLVGITLLLIGAASFEVVRRQNVTTQDLLHQLQDAQDRARQDAFRAERDALRAANLQARRIRLSVLVETCVVLRLEHQHIPRCVKVAGKVHALTRTIREFRAELRHARQVTASGGTTTVTTTVSKSPPPNPPSASPHVGNSDQCPPANPGCG